MRGPLDTCAIPDAIIDVTIPGCPKSQRSQVVTRRTKDGRVFGALAKDAPTEEWRSIARLTVQQLWHGEPITVPVRLTIWAVGQRPKNVPRWRGAGRYWREVKPDWDNVGKSSDVLVKVGVLRDDVLVAEGHVWSLVAAEGEAAHVRMVLERIDGLPIIPHPPATNRRTL